MDWYQDRLIEKLQRKVKKLENEILRRDYYSEFEVIDGLNQHKDGLNFKQWRKKIALRKDKNL